MRDFLELSEWRAATVRDFGSLFGGRKLGEGISREVYQCAINEELVIKIEGGTDAFFQNVMEWEIWQEIEGTKYAKWLAPCKSISPNGMVLLQKYASDVLIKELPKKLPKFLTDLTCGNFGRYDGRIVCRDYGVSEIIKYGFKNVEMVKADWLDAEN